MKVILVDDEAGARKTLENIITTHFPELEILASCKNIAETVNAISFERPDLLVLDIRLGEESGFDLFQRILDIDFSVVFVTAYDQYAIQAIKAGAIDYLLKPIDIEELSAVIKKVKNKCETKIQSPVSRVPAVKKIGLAFKHHFLFIDQQDIVRCQSDGSYCTFYLSSGQQSTVCRNMKEIEDSLNSSEFIRVHQSHLVNIRHIQHYIKGEGGSLIMQDGTEVPVSRRKRDDLFQHLTFLG